MTPGHQNVVEEWWKQWFNYTLLLSQFSQSISLVRQHFDCHQTPQQPCNSKIIRWQEYLYFLVLWVSDIRIGKCKKKREKRCIRFSILGQCLIGRRVMVAFMQDELGLGYWITNNDSIPVAVYQTNILNTFRPRLVYRPTASLWLLTGCQTPTGIQ